MPKRASTQPSDHSADPQRQIVIEHLCEQVAELSDELRMLREVLDDFRSEFQWAARNLSEQPHVTPPIPDDQGCESDHAEVDHSSPDTIDPKVAKRDSLKPPGLGRLF